jgi:hypothetical protein
MRVIIAAASFSPAVASGHAKYVDDFFVPTLMGAQALDAQHLPDDCSRLGPAVP